MTDFFESNSEAKKILLYGEAGTGKTVSAVTLLEAGQKVRFLATEKNAVSGLKKGMQLLKKRVKPEVYEDCTSRLSLSILEGTKRNLKDFVSDIDKGLKTSIDAQRKAVDPKRKDYTRYLNVIKGMQEFVDIEGNSQGCAEDWGTDTTLYVDGNTIICEAVLQQVIGSKVQPSQPDWGVAQNLYKQYIRVLTEDLECNVVLLAHPTRVIDELTRENRIYPSNLGQALLNWLPTCFGDVIWSYQDKGKFYWSTNTKTVVTRASDLPIADKLPQDFKQIFTE